MAGFTNLKQYGRFVGSPVIGKLYHWVYDAKWKLKLHVWDAFPLSIISGPAKGGFYGINLHFAPPGMRQAILSELTEHAIKYKGNQTAIFRADYDFLQTLVYEDFIKKNCFKHYLTAHCNSSFLEINPSMYDKVIRLPTANWYNYSKKGRGPY